MWGVNVCILVLISIIGTVSSQNSELCPQDGTRLPDNKSCKNYFECKNGQPVKQTCPLFTYYNCMTKECTLKIFTPCCKNDPNPPPSSSWCLINGWKVPDLSNCSKYYECVKNNITEEYCPTGQRYDWILAACVPATSGKCASPPGTNTSDLCPRDGDTLPDESNCENYFLCVNGKPVKKSCSPGTYYSCFTKTCTTLRFSPGCRKDPHCNETNTWFCIDIGLKVPNPFTCNKYFECDNSTIVEKTCPAGQKYDWLQMKCVPASQCECAPGSNKTDKDTTLTPEVTKPAPIKITDPAPTTKIPITPIPTRDPDLNESCSLNGARYIDPYDCSSYYECVNHRLVYKTCPKGLKYNCRLGVCRFQSDEECCILRPPGPCKPPTPSPLRFCSREGATIPDGHDCRSYFQCVNGHMVKKTCAPGFVWNCAIQSCSLQFFSPCCKNDPNLPNNNQSSNCLLLGLKIPNIFTCNKYFECSNFKIVENTCPYGERYDWLEAKCVKATSGPCAPENKNCPKEPISDIYDCQSYYECNDDGELTKRRCPLIKVWNCWSKMCTLSVGTNRCCLGNNNNISIELCPVLGVKTPDPSNCHKYYECQLLKKVSKSCADDEDFDAISSTCKAKKDATCIQEIGKGNRSRFCPYDGITMPDTHDCTKYFECIDGQPKKKTCPPFTVWNCFTKSCTLQIFAPCCRNDPNQNRNSSSYCLINGLSIPNPFISDEYFICENHTIVEKTCPSGQRYDWIFHICVNAAHCSCPVSSNVTTTEPTEITTPTSVTDTMCPKDGIRYPTVDDCSAYLECQKGQLVRVACAAGLNYNCETKQCEKIDHCCASNPKK